MKNVKFLLMLMFVSLLIGNGCRKDESLEFENYVIEKRTSHFLDTSFFEFHHIINILSEQSDSMIAFQTRYGFPSVYGTFKKKNETIKITTIPLVKYNKITGVFRIYITHEDSVRIHFFSKENIDSAMTTSLNSKNFHLYNGAIQGYVFSAAKRGETIDNKYIQWLEGNQNRLEERVGFYCIEDWDCIEAFRDSNTGNIYSDREFTDYIGPGTNASGNGLYGFFHCFLISYECYYDWSQHGYISTSGNNWNHYPWVTNSTSGGAGNGNNNPKIKPWEEQVILDAKDCLQDAGINGAIVKAGLEEVAKNSCGNSYNDLLAETYINLIEQNKDCTDGEAWKEEMENTINKESGFGSTLDPNQGNPLSSTNRLCPDNIIIKQSSWESNFQNVGGISGLQISLNGGVALTFENLFFDVDQPKDCNYPTQNLIADAINSAITISNNNLDNNLPIFNQASSLSQNVQFIRLLEKQLGQLGRDAGCTYTTPNGQNSFFSGSVTPSNYENGVGLDCHKGATFVNFTNLSTGC
ncbi:MAG: hypothetical protein IPN79_08120 [Saprospiraceae bacterium]|nr:hypothetical protein [Saprospiraceae bacterium]